MPGICFATKNLIKDIQDKQWPVLEESTLLEEDSNKESQVKYVACHTHEGERFEPAPESNEVDIFTVETHDINPLIFYRLGKPLREGAELPYLALEGYFEKSDEHGLELTVTPNYDYLVNDVRINTDREEYERICNVNKNFDPKLDKMLLAAMDKYMLKKTLEDKQIEGENEGEGDDEDRYKKVDISKMDIDEELKQVPEYDLQVRTDTLLFLNKMLKEQTPLIPKNPSVINQLLTRSMRVQGSNSQGREEPQKQNPLFVPFLSLLPRWKQYLLEETKNCVVALFRVALPSSDHFVRAVFNRADIMQRRENEEVDDRGEWTTFSVAMQKCKEHDYVNLRVDCAEELAWEAKFLGERAIDGGGLFRDSITNIIDELHSTCLPLLIPTQNNKNEHGFGRDLWTINPAATSQVHLEMYTFLGALMGMAFRAGQVISLRLSSIFWKTFTDVKVTLEDLYESDAYSVQALRDLEVVKSQVRTSFRILLHRVVV